MPVTDDPLQVPFTELRRSLDMVLNHIEAATNGPAVDLDMDYFWAIPPNGLYDVHNCPADLTIGRLRVLAEHRGLACRSRSRCRISPGWLSDVLRAIGHGVTG